MHDRRLDGRTLTFGNEGALFMNAMTWWDHETESIWSQPWGTSIAGDLRGRSLTLIPSELRTWGSWIAEHPDTLVLADERERDGFLFPQRRQIFNERFVIGVSIQDDAAAYYFPSVGNVRVRNDTLGDFPVAVFVDSETKAISVLLRNGVGRPADEDAVVPDVLTFQVDDQGVATDVETGTVWDVERGLATAGPLRGAAIQKVPYTPAFDWAWEDFFPHSTFWGDNNGKVPPPQG